MNETECRIQFPQGDIWLVDVVRCDPYQYCLNILAVNGVNWAETEYWISHDEFNECSVRYTGKMNGLDIVIAEMCIV